jgi:hypothetical protein
MPHLSILTAIITFNLLIQLTSARVALQIQNETYSFPTQDSLLVGVPSYSFSGSMLMTNLKKDVICEL